MPEPLAFPCMDCGRRVEAHPSTIPGTSATFLDIHGTPHLHAALTIWPSGMEGPVCTILDAEKMTVFRDGLLEALPLEPAPELGLEVSTWQDGRYRFDGRDGVAVLVSDPAPFYPAPYVSWLPEETLRESPLRWRLDVARAMLASGALERIEAKDG